MDITQDIRPLTEFKRDTARFVSRLKDTGRPSVLTVNGRPELVVMDAGAWQDLQDRIEYADAVAGIRRGLDHLRDGSGVRASDFFGEVRRSGAMKRYEVIITSPAARDITEAHAWLSRAEPRLRSAVA